MMLVSGDINRNACSTLIVSAFTFFDTPETFPSPATTSYVGPVLGVECLVLALKPARELLSVVGSVSES